MTPELKIACEKVFQEHKVSAQPIKWNSDTFRGRISLGLSEMAKETLIKKNIILLPNNKSKKIFTRLNPAVTTAASFAEAEEMVKNKAQVLVTSVPVDQPAFITQQVPDPVIPHPAYSHRMLSIAGESQTPVAGIKWYMKPLFYYVVWPVCAAIAGAVITFLIDLAYTRLFLDWK